MKRLWSSPPICDVCGDPATSLSSTGEGSSRRFACDTHRGSRPPTGFPYNEVFRERMTYDDAFAIMRAAQPPKRKRRRR